MGLRVPSAMRTGVSPVKLLGAFIPLQSQKAGESFRKDWEPLPPIKAFAADFNDRDGVRWRRTRGLLSRDPGDLKAKRGRTSGLCKRSLRRS
jgi:hypothetical protein